MPIFLIIWNLWRQSNTLSVKMCEMVIPLKETFSRTSLKMRQMTDAANEQNVVIFVLPNRDANDRTQCTHGNNRMLFEMLNAHIIKYMNHHPVISSASWWQYTAVLCDHGDCLHTHHVMTTSKPAIISQPVRADVGNWLLELPCLYHMTIYERCCYCDQSDQPRLEHG